MNRGKIEKGVRLILEGIGEDVTRPGLQKTPRRVAEMCEEIFSGIHEKPAVSAIFSEDVGEQLICIKNIRFHSVCEHHLLPFFGKIDIFYIPRDQRVAGFSGFSKIVDTFARRPQIQERLGRQIADEIVAALAPSGVMVLIEATHLCASMRGAHKKELKAVTRVVRGKLSAKKLQF